MQKQLDECSATFVVKSLQFNGRMVLIALRLSVALLDILEIVKEGPFLLPCHSHSQFNISLTDLEYFNRL